MTDRPTLEKKRVSVCILSQYVTSSTKTADCIYQSLPEMVDYVHMKSMIYVPLENNLPKREKFSFHFWKFLRKCWKKVTELVAKSCQFVDRI